MRKIFSHLKENWIPYGFETVVVTVGILGAFALNNWKESREIQKTEIKLLKEMVIGLNQDINTFDINISYHNGGYEASRIIKESMALDGPFVDSLSMYFSRTHNYTVFSPNTGAYESLKSLGIEIIENDEIRLKTISLYEQEYSNLQVNMKHHANYVMGVVANFNPNHFEEFHLINIEFMNVEIGSYGGRMTPINYEELKVNQVYLYHLRSLQKWHDFIKEYTIYIKDRAEALIELIQNEIDQREK